MDGKGHKFKRTSSAKASVENVLTVLKKYLNVDTEKYDIHLNFPGGVPIDGPSAGVAIAVAVYSAIKNKAVRSDIAMTGELSIRGKVKPVGGVAAKIEAAKNAGIKKVIIPKENWQELFEDAGIEVIPVEDIQEILEIVFNEKFDKTGNITVQSSPLSMLTASGV